jgi:hypothetical protein
MSREDAAWAVAAHLADETFVAGCGSHGSDDDQQALNGAWLTVAGIPRRARAEPISHPAAWTSRAPELSPQLGLTSTPNSLDSAFKATACGRILFSLRVEKVRLH